MPLVSRKSNFVLNYLFFFGLPEVSFEIMQYWIFFVLVAAVAGAGRFCCVVVVVVFSFPWFNYLCFPCLICDVADVNVGKLRSAADLAMSKGEIDKALKLWHQVIEAEPSNESNFYKRFRVHLRQQKYKEAIGDLSSAIKLKPTYEAGMVAVLMCAPCCVSTQHGLMLFVCDIVL